MIIFLRMYLTAGLLFISIVIILMLLPASRLREHMVMFWIEGDILIYTFCLLAAIGAVIGIVYGLKMIWSGAIV